MKPLFKTKRMLTATLLALVMMVAVGATLALMASTSNSVTNTFAAAQVETEIDEDLTNNNKKVTIENTGKSPVYVRARIMVSGVDPDTQLVACTQAVYDQHKEAGELNSNAVYLIMNNESVWKQAGEGVEADDYYYYLGVLEPNDSTPELLTKVIIPGEDLRTKLKDMGENFSVTVYHESVLAIDTAIPITLNKVITAFNNAS